MSLLLLLRNRSGVRRARLRVAVRVVTTLRVAAAPVTTLTVEAE